MGFVLAVTAVVLAICTVIVLIVMKRDIKRQEWNEAQEKLKGKKK